MARSGSQYERDFARMLGLWWTHDERDDIFWRTSNSGGRATARAKKGKKTKTEAADIGARDPIGFALMDLLSFELKAGYGTANVYNCMDRPATATTQKYEEFFWQAITAQEKTGAFAWALVHWRGLRAREPMIYTPRVFYQTMGSIAPGLRDLPHSGLLTLDIRHPIPKQREKHPNKLIQTHVCRSADFFRVLTPEHFHELAKVA